MNFKIIYEGQTIIIPKLTLIVIEQAPTHIILGHLTLKQHNIYRKCPFFGNDSDHAVDGVRTTGAPTLETAGNRQYTGDCSRNRKESERGLKAGTTDKAAVDFVGSMVENIGTKDIRMTHEDSKTRKITKEKRKRIHISEIFKYENDEESDELLPEDIYESYWQNPQRETDFTFKIKGHPNQKEQIQKLLRANLDIFSTTLSNIPAKLSPMKMDVDYDAFKRDKRSREPTRGQTAARKAARAAVAVSQ